jgi:hypothetical protein
MAEQWTITTEDHPDWHGLPVGVIRDAEGGLLAIQFYPEWEEHRQAFKLMRAAPEIRQEAEDLLRMLDEGRVSLYGAADAFREQAGRLRRALAE